MADDDRRLIEDYLPIVKIGGVASSEPRTKGHISTLHVWRARRPLVACRAAVYGALVAASQFEPGKGPAEKRASLGRANAAKFVERLCTYAGAMPCIQDAQGHLLDAHAKRLSQETGKEATVEDIRNGTAPRPRVLEPFAGGGAIPLEAARLGCETHAVELNPMAYLIELCAVTFPPSSLDEEIQPTGNAGLATGNSYLYGTRTWSGGLSSGLRSLVEKKKGKYRLRDYRERGDDEKIGRPAGGGDPAPVIDVLHRTLWLMENRPAQLAGFLREAQPNREQMRLVAQALAGPALKGGELSDVSPNAELSALAKLTANWRSVVEAASLTEDEKEERRSGQRRLFGKESDG